MMKIGAFRRVVAKTLTPRQTKLALKLVAKNTARTTVMRGVVALNLHTGRLQQATGQYLLGLQMTQEMRDDAFLWLGDIGYDLAVLCRVLKVKMPTATKKMKLSGTRGAALLHLSALATDMLFLVDQGLQAPQMTTVTKLVPMPQKGGVKEERTVSVVNMVAEQAANEQRVQAMRAFVAGAVDVYWRLCFDVTGQPPSAVLEAKQVRMEPPPAPVAAPKGVVKKGKAKPKEKVAVPA